MKGGEKMKKIVCVKHLTKLQWLEERRQGIFGSDASVILGTNPYRSILQLWEDKTGKVPVEEKENEYMHFGHVMESVIRKEFKRRTSLNVRICNFILQSDEYPWMRANIDGIVTEADGTKALFEAKTASEYKKEQWKDGIPVEYYAQVQHYLEVTGFKKAYVCAIIGGHQYVCHVVPRDETYIQMLIKEEYRFWKNVQDNISPVADGSKATTEYLGAQYSKGKTTEIRLEDQAEELAESFLEIEKVIKEMTRQKDALANQLKSLLKENEKGLVGDRVIKWSTITKKSLNTDKVKELLGDTLNDYLVESHYRKFSVA